MTIKAAIQLIAEDNASAQMRNVNKELGNLEDQAASSAASVSKSFDQMQRSMDSFTGPSAKGASFDFGSFEKERLSNTRDTLEQEEALYAKYYDHKAAMAADDDSLRVQMDRENEWVSQSQKSIGSVESEWDAYLASQKAIEAELAATWRERARRAADEFILNQQRIESAQRVAEVETSVDADVRKSKEETAKLLIEASRADLIRSQAEANVAKANAQVKRDQALATAEVGVKYGEAAAQLNPYIQDLVGYAQSVSDVTKGSTGFIATLGNIGVAATTLREGGFKGLLAGLDLMRIGYGTVLPIMGSIVSATYSAADAFSSQSDAAGDAAAIVGSTINQYSGLGDAIRLLGEDTDKIQGGLTQMSFRMREALETTGELQGAMGRYGVSLTDSNGVVKTSTSLLLEYADVFKSMPDGPQKTAAAMQIFGRSGAALLPVLNQGSDALRAQMGVAEALGSSYNALDGAMSDSFLAAQGRLDVFSKAVSNAIGRVATPIMTSFINVAVDLGERAFLNLSGAAADLNVQMARLGSSADAKGLDDVSRASDRAGENLRSYAEEWRRLSAERANQAKANFDTTGIDNEIKKVEERNFAILDSLRSGETELEQRRERLAAMGSESSAVTDAIKKMDVVIAKQKELIAANGGATEEYKRHVKAIDELKEAEAAFSEEQQILIKTGDALRAKNQEIFQEKVKLMVEEKSDAEDLQLAILRANRAVLDAEGKTAEARATISQTLALSRIAAERSVLDEEIKLAAQKQNVTQDIQRAEVAAMSATLKAETDFQVDRATVVEQSKQARVAAERAVFDEGVKLDQLRQNGALNVARGIKAAETKLVADQQALDVARATSAEQLASKRLELSTALFNAEMQLEEARDNRDAELTKRRTDAITGLFNAETDLMAKQRNADIQIASDRLKIISDITDTRIQRESLYETASLRVLAAIEQAETGLAQQRQANDEARATRGQQIDLARAQVLGQIIAQETQISVIRQQAEDKLLLAIMARRNAELDISQKTLQIAQIKAQLADRDMLRAQARVDAELQENQLKLQGAQIEEQKIAYSERGLSLTQACTGAFGQMNVAAQGVAVTVGQITQSLMETVKQTANLSGQLGSIIQGPGGGPSGALTINGQTIDLPQQGVPGVAGMQSVQLYQNRIANERALEDAKRRNDEAAKLAESAKAFSDEQKKASEARLSEAQRDRLRLQKEIDDRKKSIDLESQNGDLRLQLMALDTQSSINSTRLQTQFTASADKLLLQQRMAQLGLQNVQSQNELNQFGSVSGLLMDQKRMSLQGSINSQILDIRSNYDPAYQSLLQRKAIYDQTIKNQQDVFAERFGTGGSNKMSPAFGREPQTTVSDRSVALLSSAIVKALERADIKATVQSGQAMKQLSPLISRGIRTGEIPVSSRGVVNDA